MTKPYMFQSGFVANRYVREAHVAYPKAEIDLVECKGNGRAKMLKDGSYIWVGTHAGFMIRKIEAGETTYFCGIEDGFQPWEGAPDGAPG